jgi:hypothetical protein
MPRDIGLLDCRFDAIPVLRSAVIDTLSLDGSDLPGLNADRLEARGDLLFGPPRLKASSRLKARGSRGILYLMAPALRTPVRFALLPSGSPFAAVLCFVARIEGELVLGGRRIGGYLDLVGADDPAS